MSLAPSIEVLDSISNGTSDCRTHGTSAFTFSLLFSFRLFPSFLFVFLLLKLINRDSRRVGRCVPEVEIKNRKWKRKKRGKKQVGGGGKRRTWRRTEEVPGAWIVKCFGTRTARVPAPRAGNLQLFPFGSQPTNINISGTYSLELLIVFIAQELQSKTVKMKCQILFLVSFACFLAVSAEDPPASTSDKVCEPNKEFHQDCNLCKCNADGTAVACEAKSCPETDKVADKEDTCTPGEQFQIKCNDCTCLASGLKSEARCTLKDCPDE